MIEDMIEDEQPGEEVCGGGLEGSPAQELLSLELGAPPSWQVDVITNLEALQTSLFRAFMSVPSCRHSWVNQ